MKKTAIYVRVSSKSQDIRSQVSELERWAASQDGELVWYTDKASGKSMDRPAWNKLWADLEAGKVSRIVCWRLDRLGRTASGLTKLFDDLIARNVGLFSYKDSLDLDSAAGRLMANILASVASYEREVRSERQRAGIEAVRATGKRWGGSKKGRLISVTPEQVATVKRLYSEGTGISAISRSVGLSRPTCYRLINSPAQAS
jgi:DNA invertase Pin-like site-specific DNA recombinase